MPAAWWVLVHIDQGQQLQACTSEQTTQAEGMDVEGGMALVARAGRIYESVGTNLEADAVGPVALGQHRQLQGATGAQHSAAFRQGRGHGLPVAVVDDIPGQYVLHTGGGDG